MSDAHDHDDAPAGHSHGGGHDEAGHGSAGHSHSVAADADRRYLSGALALIVAFLITEVVVGIIAGSLALITDAGHMLTDAASIVLALIAIRLSAKPAQGRWTNGYKRAEILSPQANGLTLLLLAVWFIYEGIRRLIDPPQVEGLLVFLTALVGIAINIAAAWLISKANRTSLNVEGAFQHILGDLYAFIATAIAGLVVLLTGFARADAIAALIVAALMIKAGYGLVRYSGRIFLEAAPANLNPELIGPAMASQRRRSARPAHLGRHLQDVRPVRAHPGRPHRRLPRGPPGPGGAATRRLQHRPHHLAGRPRPGRPSRIGWRRPGRGEL